MDKDKELESIFFELDHVFNELIDERFRIDMDVQYKPRTVLYIYDHTIHRLRPIYKRLKELCNA